MSHRPVLRRCVACRQLLDRRQLWRVIRDHQDGVLLDEGMGRSAYLCREENCLEEATRRKRLQKACLLYTSPSPRDRTRSRMPSSA